MLPAPRVIVAAAALALAVVLVGCGGSSGDGAADATTTAAGAVTTTRADDPATTSTESPTTTEAKTTTTAPAADPKAVCAPLKALGNIDARANSVVATGDWPKIKAFYLDQTDDIVAIYDDAIAADSAITADLETLRQVTVDTGAIAGRSTSLIDFGSKLVADPAMSASGAATLRANDFTEKTCGFSLGPF